MPRGPVLLGSRCASARRGEFAHILFVWLPVLLMLLVIVRESTESFGATNTSALLRPVYEAIFGHVSETSWEHAHHVIRKTGHFLGYGLLGLTYLRAFLYTWLWSFRRHAAGVWRRWSLQMALFCTALVAGLDELHQSYLANRTGVVSDVLLDTAGAAVLTSLCATAWLRRSAAHAEFSITSEA